MTSSFFGRRLRTKALSRVFGNWAVLILCMVFFCVPFSMRGARLALQDIKNEIKDWLPSDFPETRDLTWFGHHFLSEKFVVLSFPGCKADDERYKLFHRKLLSEVAPPEGVDEYAGKSAVERERIRARRRADDLGLFSSGDPDFRQNWGGLNEKWLQGDGDRWYYILPDGRFFRWTGESHLMGAISRGIERSIKGKVVHGVQVDHFGAKTPKGKLNEFHQDPRKLTARYLSSVISGPEVLKQLTEEKNGPLWPRGDYDEEEKKSIATKAALDRLEGNLFGPDREQTCLVVTLSKHGEAHFDRVVARGLLGKPLGKLQQIAKECGIQLPPSPPVLPFTAATPGTEPMLRMGGPPVDNVAIDEEGTITLVRLIGFSVGLGVLLSYICFRQIVVTIMVFVVGGVSAITSLGLVFYTGGSVDAVLLSMPSLVYVLGLSGAVHIVNYYRDAVAETGSEEGAAERALAHGWMPCTLAAITTAIGLLSLRTSNLVPISKFGTYSAIGVVATLALLFTYLPAALEIWRPTGRRRESSDPDQADQQNSQPAESFLITHFWEPIGTWIVNHYAIVGVVCLLVMVGCGLGLRKIRTSVQLLKLFDQDAQVIQDYRWLEGNLGKLVPMELIVRVSPDMIGPTFKQQMEKTAPPPKQGVFPLSLLERAELAKRIQEAVENEFGDQGRGTVGRGTSTVTFLPNLPRAGGSRSRQTYRNIFSKKVEEDYQRLLELDYLARDDQKAFEGSELWRISLRLAALTDVDYGVFVKDLKLVIEPVLEAYRCRTKILQQLQDKFPRDYGGIRILALGTKRPRRTKSKNSDQQKLAKSGKSDSQGNELRVNQTNIFALTLHDLLKNHGFVGRASVRWRDDPSKVKDASYQEARCVVIVGDWPEDKLSLVRKHVPIVIDARSHRVTKDTPVTSRDESIHVVYTGVVPIVYKAQRTLLVSLVDSIKWAFVLIALVMVVLLNPGRSIADGLHPVNVTKGVMSGMVAMIPNLYPVVMIFGIMCHMGIAIDIGSMMTASVAMGVAVDDTIHFLSWFRKSIQQGLNRRDAIIETYRRVGPAMTQTTLIGGLGLSVFGLSTFTPTQRFGLLMLTLLLAALMGDLIFLPALLASPLGKLFMPRGSEQQTDNRRPPMEESLDTPVESKAHNAPHTRQGKTPVRSRVGGRQIRHDSGHT